MISASIRTGRQAAVLRAQARNLKKAWRRGQVKSKQLLEQLLQQLSLSSGARSSGICRPGPNCCCMQSLQYSSTAGVHDRDEINEVKGSASIDDHGGDDYDDDRPVSTVQIGPANFFMSLASCCIKVHHLSYQPLLNDLSLSGESPSQAAPEGSNRPTSSACQLDANASTVLLKVGILGDSNTGKTSFMAKYVCPKGEVSPEFVETLGVATEKKVVRVQSGTQIAFNIWDLGGHWQCRSMVPLVCRDAVAILIMFDLTRRATLNSVMDWFAQASECNKVAMIVMIGTKYDHFVELPQNIQLAITQQARVYAKTMRAPLFFSSVIHNINVHKVFKVIVAKLFDLPCPIPVNLNFGEPLVDY